MELKVSKLHDSAVIPFYATTGSAGLDLTAIDVEVTTSEVGESGGVVSVYTYDTGLAFSIPPGYVGLLAPRSSIHKTSLSLVNSVGIIDSDYRGPVKAKFEVTRSGDPYSVGDRIAQLVIVQAPSLRLVEVDSLDDTQRGSGGFGSTGS